MQFFTTRSEAREYLRSLGLSPVAVEAMLADTAQRRHEYRVQQVVETAQRAIRQVMPHAEDESVRLLTAAMAWADYVGVGGRADVEGLATARLPAFGVLGAGRKHAADGGAWSAAIFEAAREVSPQGAFYATHGTLYFREPGYSIYLPSALVPYRWQRSIIHDAVRRGVGLDTRHPYLPISGDLRDWGAAYQIIQTALQKESAIDEEGPVCAECPT